MWNSNVSSLYEFHISKVITIYDLILGGEKNQNRIVKVPANIQFIIQNEGFWIKMLRTPYTKMFTFRSFVKKYNWPLIRSGNDACNTFRQSFHHNLSPTFYIVHNFLTKSQKKIHAVRNGTESSRPILMWNIHF